MCIVRNDAMSCSYIDTQYRSTSLSITRQECLYCCVLFSLGVWVWLTALPTLILNSKKEDTEICTRDYIGWSLWLVGMLIEAIADYQKYTFRNNRANKYVCSYIYSIIRLSTFNIILYTKVKRSASMA